MKSIDGWALLAAGICIGLTLPYAEKCLSATTQRKSKNNGVFFLGITIIFNTMEDKQNFMDIFTPFAKFVAMKELGTISYEVSEP
jgi:hypothetical protein